jgi:integrase
MPRRGHARGCRLTVAQIRDLFQSCLTERERIVVGLVFYTGFRASEVAHLRPQWVDLKERVITIPDRWPCSCARCARKGGVWRPKTPTGARRVPIFESQFEALLRAWLDKPSLKSNSPERVSQVVLAVGRRAGLPQVYCHGLRSARAYYLRRVGLDERDLMRAFGWKDYREVVPYAQAAEEEEMILKASDILPAAEVRDRLNVWKPLRADFPDPAFA